MKTLLNFLLFQACWLACVLGSARGLPWLGPLLVAAWCAAHVGRARPALRRRLGLLLLAAGLFGFLVDTLHLRLGVLRFTDAPEATLSRPWMVALWVAFAATLDSSLAWLSGRLHVAAVLGAAAGPLSYLAGARLGAVTLPTELSAALLVIAISWGFSLPLLVFAADRLLGRRRELESSDPAAA